MNETNIQLSNNISNCLVKTFNFTEQVVTNVCTGNVYNIPFGNADLMLSALLILFMLVFLLKVIFD